MANSDTSSRLLEVRNGVTFLDCLIEATQTPIVTEWERLSGKKLVSLSPLDRMIDDATGYGNAVLGEYVDFVYEFVFLTM